MNNRNRERVRIQIDFMAINECMARRITCRPRIKKEGAYYRVICTCGHRGHMNFTREGAIKLWNSETLNPEKVAS